MKLPEQFNGLVGELGNFHQQMSIQATALPPSSAKEMLEELLKTVEPMIGELQGKVDHMQEAFEKQYSVLEDKLQQSKQNVDQAKSNMRNLPPVDQVKANIIPVAKPIPAGLSSAYGDELQKRYQPPVIVDLGSDPEGTAWQDWSMS